jgi:hypothetical protein
VPQPPDGLGVIQPQAALLNDLVRPARLAVKAPGLQRQGQGVQRLQWWMQQEPDDVERALLVFENRVPAFKCRPSNVSSQKPTPRHRAYWRPSRWLRSVVCCLVLIESSLCLYRGLIRPPASCDWPLIS